MSDVKLVYSGGSGGSDGGGGGGAAGIASMAFDGLERIYDKVNEYDEKTYNRRWDKKKWDEDKRRYGDQMDFRERQFDLQKGATEQNMSIAGLGKEMQQYQFGRQKDEDKAKQKHMKAFLRGAYKGMLGFSNAPTIKKGEKKS
jgi:hypothetical protein